MVKAVCSSWRKTTSRSRQKFHCRVLLFWWRWSWCAAAHELWVFHRHWRNWGFKVYVMIWGMIVELQLVGHRVLLLYLKISLQCNHLTCTQVCNQGPKSSCEEPGTALDATCVSPTVAASSSHMSTQGVGWPQGASFSASSMRSPFGGPAPGQIPDPLQEQFCH